jgi:hypothetical protein
MDTFLLCGAWALVDYEIETPGDRRRPIGEGIKGRLLLTADGVITVVITGRFDPSVSQRDTIAYFGRYELRGAELWAVVEVSNVPAHLETKQLRRWVLHSDELTLESDHPTGLHIVRWKRWGRTATPR